VLGRVWGKLEVPLTNTAKLVHMAGIHFPPTRATFAEKFMVEDWPEMGAGGSKKVLYYFLYTLALYIKLQSL